jgi:hypothetical protein
MPKTARIAPILKVEAALRSIANAKYQRLLKWFKPAKGGYITAYLTHRAL